MTQIVALPRTALDRVTAEVRAASWFAALGEEGSPFESKFRLFAAGRWPLGIVGSRLILF